MRDKLRQIFEKQKKFTNNASNLTQDNSNNQIWRLNE